MTGTSSAAYKMEASPHGIHWIPHPADDVDGWARIREACPFAFPAQGLLAAGLPEGHDVWLITYSFPVVTGYPDTPESIAYWWTKAVYESYDLYKDVMPQMVPWNIAEYGLHVPRMYPFHEGAIRYFKEQGWWTDVLERNQKALIERSEGLAELWQATLHEALVEEIPRGEFPAFWVKKRAEKFPGFYTPITE